MDELKRKCILIHKQSKPSVWTVFGFYWRCGVVVITTAQLHSSKSELRFCAGSYPACGMSEIRDGEDLWQMSWLEIGYVFRQSTIPKNNSSPSVLRANVSMFFISFFSFEFICSRFAVIFDRNCEVSQVLECLENIFKIFIFCFSFSFSFSISFIILRMA